VLFICLANIKMKTVLGILLLVITTVSFGQISGADSEKADLLIGHIHKTEKVLFNAWKPYINDLNQVVTDATCYESELRYPTDQKLLWEAVHWLYQQLKTICKLIGIKLLRTKYRKVKSRYQGYSKMRRKTTKKRKGLTRSLLHLLHKLLNFEDELNLSNNKKIELNTQYYKRLAIIHKICQQQKMYFETGKNIKNRIVSIHKDYIRPIVRGKETKSVEFGAKVNKIMIDGISFIEHLSFNSFNEGTRLKSSIAKAQSLTQTKTLAIGADKIYATNKNRTYCSEHGIKTDFIPKGRKSKDHKEKQVIRNMISKERSTRLEGSFGKDKNHYYLKTIKARTQKNEILWIFLGIHTGNALEIGRRKLALKEKQAA